MRDKYADQIEATNEVKAAMFNSSVCWFAVYVDDNNVQRMTRYFNNKQQAFEIARGNAVGLEAIRLIEVKTTYEDVAPY